MKFEATKKHFFTDLIVLGFLLVGAVIYFLVMQNQRLGWEMKGKTETLTDTEKEVTENILIYNGGKLKLVGSDLVLKPKFDSGIGIFIEGDSKLVAEDSTIDFQDYQYFVSTSASKGYNPEILLENSSISGHAGIYLHDRTKVSAKDSSIGKIQLRDKVNVSLINTDVFPVFFSDQKETFENLKSGDGISSEIKAKEGWKLKLENCNVLGYEIDALEKSSMTIKNSKDVTFSWHTSGSLMNPVNIISPVSANPSSGKITSLGFEMTWEKVQINAFNLYVSGKDNVNVTKGIVNGIEVLQDAKLNVSNATVFCNSCKILKSANLSMSNVIIAENEDLQPTITIKDSSKVTISNSDISKLHVFLEGNASLSIVKSKYNVNFIKNTGLGSVSIDGKNL